MTEYRILDPKKYEKIYLHFSWRRAARGLRTKN
jgi:hypothetical protein